jgi:hypothetical protein
MELLAPLVGRRRGHQRRAATHDDGDGKDLFNLVGCRTCFQCTVEVPEHTVFTLNGDTDRLLTQRAGNPDRNSMAFVTGGYQYPEPRPAEQAVRA